MKRKYKVYTKSKYARRPRDRKWKLLKPYAANKAEAMKAVRMFRSSGWGTARIKKVMRRR